MITLEEYKHTLLNYYRWPIDGTLDRYKEREKRLNILYPDEFLSKVIEDSYSFLEDILSSDTLEDNYCKFDLDEDTSFGIDLLISGGGDSDDLYKDASGKMISGRILRSVFGEYFHIEVRCNEIERECEEDVLSFDYHYYLYMQGFPKNIKEIKEQYLGKSKTLKDNKC